MLTILAQAEDAAESTAGGWQILVLYAVIIGAIFYFLMIRPQRNRVRKHQELVGALAVGDEVTTIGGIFGTIEFMDDETDTAVIQTEGGGRLRVARRALAGKVTT